MIQPTLLLGLPVHLLLEQIAHDTTNADIVSRNGNIRSHLPDLSAGFPLCS